MPTEMLPTPQFLPRTTLLPGEYRADFRQIDRDAIRLVRSRAAREVTKLMAHVYLCLIDAPIKFRERDGVLRFTGEVREGKTVTAWEQLTELLEVADGTAHKALAWMAELKLIGYFAGKNGVGIRIFLNRAASSVRKEAEQGQKNLRRIPAAAGAARVSPDAMPSNNCGRKFVDEKINPHAPKSSATTQNLDEISSKQSPILDQQPQPLSQPQDASYVAVWQYPHTVLGAEVMERLKRELEPCVRNAATQAASQVAAREHERTREWLDKHGLPKAARVAQREAYQIFRQEKGKLSAEQRARAELQVGRGPVTYPLSTATKACTPAEIAEAAEMCLTMLEVQGKPIEETLDEFSVEGGWLLLDDVPRVREAAGEILRARSARRCDP